MQCCCTATCHLLYSRPGLGSRASTNVGHSTFFNASNKSDWQSFTYSHRQTVRTAERITVFSLHLHHSCLHFIYLIYWGAPTIYHPDLAHTPSLTWILGCSLRIFDRPGGKIASSKSHATIQSNVGSRGERASGALWWVDSEDNNLKAWPSCCPAAALSTNADCDSPWASSCEPLMGLLL